MGVRVRVISQLFFGWKIHLTGVDKFGSGLAMAIVRNMTGNFFSQPLTAFARENPFDQLRSGGRGIEREKDEL